jgi:hypothetical protein
MENQLSRLFVVLAAFVLAGSPAFGCDGDSGSSDSSNVSDSGGIDLGSSTSGNDAVSTGSDGSQAAGGGASLGSGSHFGSVTEFFDYLNSKRESYANHKRYSGFPFSGGYYHSNETWPIKMQWSETAAVSAQSEADAVAKGSTPSGKQTFANPGQLPIAIHGINSTGYMVGGKERPGSFPTETCTLCNSNPFMRMAVFYHDPGGEGPVLTKVGIGAADLGNGHTWWVMRFAP